MEESELTEGSDEADEEEEEKADEGDVGMEDKDDEEEEAEEAEEEEEGSGSNAPQLVSRAACRHNSSSSHTATARTAMSRRRGQQQLGTDLLVNTLQPPLGRAGVCGVAVLGKGEARSRDSVSTHTKVHAGSGRAVWSSGQGSRAAHGGWRVGGRSVEQGWSVERSEVEWRSKWQQAAGGRRQTSGEKVHTVTADADARRDTAGRAFQHKLPSVLSSPACAEWPAPGLRCAPTSPPPPRSPNSRCATTTTSCSSCGVERVLGVLPTEAL